MQLRTPAGNVPVTAPLLEVSKISDAGIGTFAEVRCVGRARLRELHSGSRARGSPFRDARSVDGEAGATNAVLRVRELHAACHYLDWQLGLTQGHPAAVLEPARELQELQPGVRSLAESSSRAVRLARPAARFSSGLDELVASRRSSLLSSRSAECMHAPSLERLPLWHEGRRWDDELWAARPDLEATVGEASGGDDAELVLLSFAACAPLSSFERLHALDTTITLERLASAATALERQRARLAAMLALRHAALG